MSVFRKYLKLSDLNNTDDEWAMSDYTYDCIIDTLRVKCHHMMYKLNKNKALSLDLRKVNYRSRKIIDVRHIKPLHCYIEYISVDMASNGFGKRQDKLFKYKKVRRYEDERI